MKNWIIQSLIAFDQLVNALLGGYADETLSSRAYRADRDNKILGKFFRPLIDGLALLFGEKDHCHRAYLAELFRRQFPRELQ